MDRNRLTSPFLIVGIAALTMSLLLAACGNSRSETLVQSEVTIPNESVPVTEGSATSSVPVEDDEGAGSTTSSTAEQLSDPEADLKAEGDVLRADKRDNATKNGYEPFNAGDYAYPSKPVEITAPGDYETLVGPIDDWVHYELTLDKPVPLDNSPTAWVIKQRSDQTFNVAPFEIHVVTEGGQRFLAVKFTVTEQRPGGLKPYPGYVFWLY
jgi:hypothetical protein